MRASLAYILRMTITVYTHGDYPKYLTPNKEMIAKMLHLPLDKNKFHNEQSAQSMTEGMVEYKIDSSSVYDILDLVCKDTDLYTYVKQHKSKSEGRGAFYAICSRWLGMNHVNVISSEAKMALQMSMYDGKKKVWNWEKYIVHHVKYHIILENHVEYGYHGLDSGSKV